MSAEQLAELLRAVDARFARRDPALVEWSDPYPDRDPPDEAYSRDDNPERYRIVEARLDAWIDQLIERGLATIEADVEVEWAEPRSSIDRNDRLVPVQRAAMSIIVGRRTGGARVPELGSDEPVSQALWRPDICCDACDSGSADLLETLDEMMAAVVTGTFRRLCRGGQQITVSSSNGWSASNFRGPTTGTPRLLRAPGRRRTVEEVLADPRGWNELRGESWFG